MREFYEFRLDESFAPLLFSSSEGKRLGESIRKVQLRASDPRFVRVGELQRALRASHGRPFFFGWSLTRRYSVQEVKAAKLFHLRITSEFDPAGEECGTQYDETTACRQCGAGARQAGSLVLDVRRIPKSKDIAKTIAGELIVARRVAERLRGEHISGVDLRPVRTMEGGESASWFQLMIRSAEVDVAPPTRTGIDPFDDDENGEYRCPLGHVIGLNLLSEVSVREGTRGDADASVSRQFIGARRGLLRPERLILVSPRLRDVISRNKVKGCQLEIAHLVSVPARP